jgi:hypothetical protein
VVGRIVLLLVVALVSCTGMPSVMPAMARSEAWAQSELAKPKAVAEPEAPRARVATRTRCAPPATRTLLLRQPHRASVPRSYDDQAWALHLSMAAILSDRSPLLLHDRRDSVRRARVCAHIPRMDDDPPRA